MRKLFKNQVICFTGKSKYTRYQMEKLAVEQGAKVVKNVNDSTTILVMGLRPGSKLDRGIEKNIKLMLDDEFLSLIGK